MSLTDFLILVLIALVLWIILDAALHKPKKPLIPKAQRTIFFELMEELGYSHHETFEALKNIRSYEEIVNLNRRMRQGIENHKIKKHAGKNIHA